MLQGWGFGPATRCQEADVIGDRGGGRGAGDGRANRYSPSTSSYHPVNWSRHLARRIKTCSGQPVAADQDSLVSSSVSACSLVHDRWQCTMSRISFPPKTPSRTSSAGCKGSGKELRDLEIRPLTIISKDALDPMVELVCLAFTRGRLFGVDKCEEGQDPLESMVIVRGVSMTNSEVAAKEMLRPLLDCPHLDKAEVKVEIEPTSMSEEYGECGATTGTVSIRHRHGGADESQRSNWLTTLPDTTSCKMLGWLESRRMWLTRWNWHTRHCRQKDHSSFGTRWDHCCRWKTWPSRSSRNIMLPATS